jgi:hypothetical protein
MQDDIEVRMRELRRPGQTGAEEEQCSLCGFPYPARLLALRAGEQDEGIRSDYEYFCPQCGALLLLGEEPGFPLEER